MKFWLQHRTLAAYGVSILALAEIIDLTIVAIAIPQMMGSLGATIDTIAMVTTAYIVSAAVFILLSGIIIKKYGMKRVALVSGTLFLISSILCALSTSLNEIIIYRILQGIGGAFLPSVAQSYISQKFIGQEQVKMMTVFSLVVVMGPIIGPVMGGVLVLELSWRWIFYVNIPICIIGLLLIFIFMEKSKSQNIYIDFISFFFMAIGIGCLEYFIDTGNQNDWLNSIKMIIIICLSIILLFFFIWRGKLGTSILNFNIFKNINFILSCFVVFVFMIFATASFAYFPTMMQTIYNLPSDITGYISSPRGIAAIIFAPFLPKIIKTIGAKLTLCSGIISFSIGSLILALMSIDLDIKNIIIAMIFQGYGLMAVFVPLMQICLIGIMNNENADASGVFNFARNFGASVGTSMSATVISQQIQVHKNSLVDNTSFSSTGLILWEQNIPNIDYTYKINILNNLIEIQSNYLSYLNMFLLCSISLLFILWVPFVLKNSSTHRQESIKNENNKIK